MVVGITTWGDRVSPVLDTAEQLLVFDAERGPEAARVVVLSGLTFWTRAAAIGGAGIDVLICGAVTRPLLEALTASGLTVVPWVSGAVDDILQAFSCGETVEQRFAMPGCGRARRGRQGACERGRRGRGRRRSERRPG